MSIIEPALKPMAVKSAKALGLSMGEADLDDCVQDILTSLYTSDLHKFESSKGSIFGFVQRRVYWSVREFAKARWKTKEVPFAIEEHDFGVASVEDEFETMLRALMAEGLVREIRETVEPLEADAILSLVSGAFPSVAQVAKKHRTKPWRVYEARKTGFAAMKAHLIKEWDLE